MSAAGTATGPLDDLGAKLGSADDTRLLRVVALVDRLPRRGPADRLLAPVRPRLAVLRPPRPASPERVLGLPLEDLLAPAEECWPGRRRLSRPAFPPLAAAVMGALEPALARELRAAAAGRDTRSTDAVLAVGARLWPEASRLIEGPLREAGREGPLPPEPQLRGVAALLSLAPALVPVLWALPPKPMTSLPPGAPASLAPVLAAARAKGPDALLWLLELLLARSLSADLVLGLVGGLGLPARERDACATQLVRGRIADMRRAAERLELAADRPTADVVDDLVGLVADLDVLDDRWVAGAIDRSLLKGVRETTADVLTRRLDRAVGEDLLERFERLAPGPAQDAEVERVEEVARAVRRLGVAGAQLGLAGASRDMFLPFLESYRARFLARARGGGGAAAPACLEQVRLVEILFGPAAAMGLVREARGVAGSGA